MKALFAEAEGTDLWFHCLYQDLWFSPTELRREQKNGRFRWGAVNWKLENPATHLGTLKNKCETAQREYDAFKNRLKESKNAQETTV